jgi:hypothetical protein
MENNAEYEHNHAPEGKGLDWQGKYDAWGGGGRELQTFLLDKQEVSDHSEDLAVKGMMVLKWNLNEKGVRFWAAVSCQPRISSIRNVSLVASPVPQTAYWASV